MKSVHLFGVASLGVALAAACGGSSSNGPSDGGSDGTSSGSGSGSGSGGTASSSGSSSSGGHDGGSSSSGASSSGGRRDAGPRMATNDCPNCPGTQVCCLSPADGGSLQGTCAAAASACPSGAASIECGGAADCNTGQSCCITIGSSGGASSTSCQSSCPSGSPPACGGMPGDNTDCDPAGTGAGWACIPLAGTPQAVIGQCVPAEGGAPPVDAGDAAPMDGGMTPDADTGAPSQDAETDSG